MTGVISLYDIDGVLIQTRVYSSKNGRERTIAIWKKLYVKLDGRSYIQIYPTTKITAVKKNGKNAIGREKKVEKDPPKPQIVRPPAIYDNKKSVYNYD